MTDTLTTLKSIPKGEIFKLTENGRELVRGSYCREVKKFSCHYFDDVGHERLVVGSKLVIVGFTF